MPAFENFTEGEERAWCFSCPCCCCHVWARVCVWIHLKLPSAKPRLYIHIGKITAGMAHAHTHTHTHTHTHRNTHTHRHTRTHVKHNSIIGFRLPRDRTVFHCRLAFGTGMARVQFFASACHTEANFMALLISM